MAAYGQDKIHFLWTHLSQTKKDKNCGVRFLTMRKKEQESIDYLQEN